ncbi:MAG TPA: 2-oxo-4-hydroxy-4-carboxy-5-ureidoimidazoline decarboxylase [Thermoanaerobaculia bacterium]
MTPALARWNGLSGEAAAEEMLALCGSRAWARCVAGKRPLDSGKSLLAAAAECWEALPEGDRLEAFAAHPRIGDRQAKGAASVEQAGVRGAGPETIRELERANRDYEARFGRVFLVCATGKSAEEMLALCRQRLQNDPRVELEVASAEQKKITALRLQRWLAA